MLQTRIHNALQQRRQNTLYRTRRRHHTSQLNFSSNDYLALAQHPQVIAASSQAAKTYGASSSGSQLLNGYTEAHHQLEQKLAEFLGFPRVMLFSSGYMANLGVIQSLMQPGDCVFHDRDNHASLLDGSLASRARLQRYQHQDSTQLATLFAQSNHSATLVVSDGVFSMTGEVAPISQLSQLCQQHQAWLLIDDSHGIGVIGEHGRGSLEISHCHHQQVNILTGSLAKGFGSVGGFVAADEATIEYCIQFARSYIYTSAPSPITVAAATASLDIMQQEPERRQQLATLIEYFSQRVKQHRLPFIASPTPIQSMIVGNAQQVMRYQHSLQEKNMLVAAIRPPTVAKNSSRLRITLTTNHTESDIEQLIDALATCHREHHAHETT